MRGTESLQDLEERIGHRFARRDLLERALTHKSYVNEHAGEGLADNERLEFLGDAVLGLAVGHMLMQAHPQLREGELSMMRAHVVSERGLCRIARALELGDWLHLGKGEDNTGGRDKPSLLADACEAIVAAVYLDAGFEAARDVVHRLFADAVAAIEMPGRSDFKTRLQEYAQARFKEPPTYAVVGESGPDHDKTFEVAVSVQGRELARATGKSKKESEQRAAEAALRCLTEGETTLEGDEA